MCLAWLKTWNNGTYCTVKTHRALWPACDYMRRCYYIATGLARKFFSLMQHFVCYLRLVFAPNSVPLCVASTEAPGPAAVQKYSQWWRFLEWIAWFKKWSSKAKLLTTEPSANTKQYTMEINEVTPHLSWPVWRVGGPDRKNVWLFIDRVYLPITMHGQCLYGLGASITILSTPQSSFNSQFTLRITLKTPSSRRMDDSNIAKPSIEGSLLLRTWNYQVCLLHIWRF